jgi:hypothetical protein
MVARNEEAHKISDYVKKHYRLILPSLPTRVWNAFARDPYWRAHLFDAIGQQSWRLVPPEPVFERKEVLEELSKKRFAEILSDSGFRIFRRPKHSGTGQLHCAVTHPVDRQ